LSKIAFVFPGQGAQYSGMGKSFYEGSDVAAKLFDELGGIRPNTSAQCFSGSAEELSQTINTQPCILAFELAATAALLEKGITPDFAAGFSLGEIAGVAAAGGLSPTDAFRLVVERAKLMQADAEKADSTMAAVLKLAPETLEGICAKFEGVYPVNYNCPGQITIACLRDALPDFTAAVKDAGGRVMPLKVGGGFHSPFMNDASAGFRKVLEAYDIKEFAVPLYSNTTALPYDGNPADILANQIINPVRWEQTIRNLADDGAEIFIEIGPGTVLSGFVKKTLPEAVTYSLNEFEQLAELATIK
jgi:[acyl-carrier-protein] S-malonyltransferase